MMTFAEIALELGVDERTARRTVAAVIAKLRAGLGETAPPDLVVRVLVRVLDERDFLSTENATISRAPRRFSDNQAEHVDDASRAAPLGRVIPPPRFSSGGERRAVQRLPSRFAKRTP